MDTLGRGKGIFSVVRGQEASLQCRVMILIFIFFSACSLQAVFFVIDSHIRLPKLVPLQLQSGCALAALLSVPVLHSSALRRSRHV